MRVIPVIIALVALLATAVGSLRPAAADVPSDYDIPNGRFFTQTNGATSPDPSGYAVTNDGGIPMWSEFQRLGGLPTVGYPVSRRFVWNGFTVQAFQKVVLQWRPEAKTTWPINVLDLMHDQGKDGWLANFRSTPPPLPADFDGGKPWPEVVAARLALLNDNPAMKQRYFTAADPMAFYGLPVSRIIDNGNHFVIRLQRATIQQWKVDVPWAKAGQVTIANAGDLAKEAGLLPKDVTSTELPPWGGGRVVVIDPGHGGAEIGTAYRFADGTTLLEKDLNLRVALKVADLLARAGYKPVLTRTTDTEVNRPAKLLTRRPPIGLDDELQARIDIANNSGAKLFLSIHFNGHPDSRLRGSEVYYCRERPLAADSRRFADLLLSNLISSLAGIGYRDDDASVKDDSQALRPGEHFYLLGPANSVIVRPSTMPAALAEGLFVTNSLDATTLRVERTLDAIARAYATAVHQYFAGSNKALLPTGSPAPTSPAPAASASPTTTPSPPPSPTTTPTPSTRPTLGQGTIAVDFGDGALMRREASSAATIVGSIPNGATVDLLEAVNGQAVIPGDVRWYRAGYAGHEGFVYGQLVRRADNNAPAAPPPPTPVATPAPSVGQGRIAVDFGDGAMLRADASSKAAIVASIANGATVDLLQTVSGQVVIPGDARWYRARYAGREGFVYAQLVRRADNNAPPVPSTTSTPVATPTAALGQGRVAIDFGEGAMLRAEASSASALVASIPNESVVDLLQAVTGEAVIPDDQRWYRARYGGREGFVYALLVELVRPTTPAAGTSPPGKGTIIAEAGVKVRSAPSSGATVVGTLSNGTVVTLLASVSGEPVLAANGARWYRVGAGGIEGYVYGGLIQT